MNKSLLMKKRLNEVEEMTNHWRQAMTTVDISFFNSRVPLVEELAEGFARSAEDLRSSLLIGMAGAFPFRG